MSFPGLTPELVRTLNSVLIERSKQDAKWGQQNHEFPIWLAILTEELGETSQAFLKLAHAKQEAEAAARIGAPNDGRSLFEKKTALREELVQMVAVALATLECCDRNGWDQ